MSESIRNVARPTLAWTVGFEPGTSGQWRWRLLRPAIASTDVNAASSYLALVAPHIKKPDVPSMQTTGRWPYGSLGLFIPTPEADAAFAKVNAAAPSAGYVIVKECPRDDKGRMTRFWMRDAEGAKLMIMESHPMPLFLKKVPPSILRR